VDRASRSHSVVEISKRAIRKKIDSSDEEVTAWLRRHELTKKEGEAIELVRCGR
jgi:hypothetical protein